MVTLRPILFINGLLLLPIAISMAVLAFIDALFLDQIWQAFAASATLTFFIGVLLALAYRTDHALDLSIREAFLLTSSCWFLVSALAALPFLWSQTTTTYADSFFEAVSALTTTGSTVIIGLDKAPYTILMWRAFLQFLGGVGIIVMAMTVIPFLKIGGAQLFQTESSDRSEKILPHASQIARSILVVYSILTILCMICLRIAGMDAFDALCHAMAAVSTGGLSTHDASIAYFNNNAIEWVLIIFMFIGGSTLIAYTRALHYGFNEIVRDSQIQVYTLCLIGFSLLIGLCHWWQQGTDLSESLRHSTFNTVSLVTTTGFTSTDYTTWGFLSQTLFLLLYFIGGCTGSTSGGVKVFRLQVLHAIAWAQMRQLRHPRGVFIPSYNNQEITSSIIASVFTFFALYGLCYALLVIGLTAFNLDLVTAFSGAASALANVGPGLGDIIGPSGSFAPVAEGAKWLLSLGMILGRLEILTILILFMPSFWRS